MRVAALAAAAAARTPAAGPAASWTAAPAPARARGLRVGYLDGDPSPVELAGFRVLTKPVTVEELLEKAPSV